MRYLPRLTAPSDLVRLNEDELIELSSEIREFLIEKVSRTGGHLGPNLGVVELTIAIHRTFQSPHDVIIFDTGHQSYVHKILTGRIEGFDLLRQRGGLAGYPNRSESAHDVVENSHASAALSWSEGIAKGFSLQGITDRTVVAVVGDGALTGGMAWEALNNIAAQKNLRLVIVVNDNERSYSPLKDIVAPQGMFEDLGLKYLGPVDGHDIAALERTLVNAKKFEGPVIVHAITEKGRGHAPAINDEAEKFHAVGVVDPETGESIAKAGRTWTEEFSDALIEIGRNRKDVVAITAAMLGPTGLDKFQKQFPDRTFDVGIAEQHAVTSAAGLAYSGLHPVVSVYSTFLNRAFDQLLLDVSLHNAGVTFVLDRAGFTGDDGPSHNGVWDLALTGIVPNLKVAAPRDGIRLKELLAESIDLKTPSLLRYPKGIIGAEIPAFESRDGIDFLYRGETSDILLISVGALAQISVDAAIQANREGVGVTVIDPRWVKPLPIDFLAKLAEKYSQIVVVEDGISHGGIASTLSEGFRALDLDIPIHSIGAPLEFFEHAKRNQILEDLGITSQAIARQIVGWYSRSFTQEAKRRQADGNVDQKPQR